MLLKVVGYNLESAHLLKLINNFRVDKAGPILTAAPSQCAVDDTKSKRKRDSMSPTSGTTATNVDREHFHLLQ